MGGRLRRFQARWRTIGAAAVIVAVPDWIDGPPREPADYTKRERFFGRRHKLMREAIEMELQNGVLKRVAAAEARFVMPAFVVMKSSGKPRLILDCRELNVYLQPCAFKMEDARDVQLLIPPGAWVGTKDLCNAFHHLPMQEDWVFLLLRQNYR